MKILITSSMDDVYSSMRSNCTRSEQKAAWDRCNPEYKKTLLECMGKWVDVETEHLFEDQFNTKHARFVGLWIVKDINFSPEFKNKDEYLAALQKQYDEKWPGRIANPYYINYLSKPKKFICGKEAFLDDEKELYYCYIGVSDSNKSLQYLAYGNTPSTAIQRAESLCYILNSIDSKILQMIKEN